jgi:hypothetical protein
MYCAIEEDDSKYWYGKMIDTLEIRVCYCVFNLVVGRKILWYFKLKILGGL